jgi:hypothetical protein
MPTTPDGTGSRDTGDGCRWLYIGPITYTSETSSKYFHQRWWRDTFYGYITGVTYSATASITMVGHSVMTVTAVSSGTITVGADVNGTGVPAGVQVYAQLTSDEAGGALGGRGTYQVTPDYLNVASTTMTGGVGILTVTTPPATHKIDVVTRSLISHPAMTDPGRVQGAGQLGTNVVSGTSRGGPFTLNRSQAIHGPGGPTDPTLMYYGRLGQVDLQTGDIHHAQLWNDHEYIPGQNGEMGPYIWMTYHATSPNDTSIDLDTEYGSSGWHAPPYATSVAGLQGFAGHVEAAPGESFSDTLAANPSLPLAEYNINYGVGIRGTNGLPALAVSENSVRWKRLQIKGDSEQAFFYDVTDRNGSDEVFERNLIQGGTAGRAGVHPATIVCLAQCYYYNNLIITTGQSAIYEVYGATVVDNTIVCPSGTCWSAANHTRNWIVTQGAMMHGNAVFGFQHFVSDDWYGEELVQPPKFPSSWATVQGVNNVTDTPSSDGADFPSTYLVDTIENNTHRYAMPFYTGATYPPSFTENADGSRRTTDPPICAWSPGVTPIFHSVLTHSTCTVTHGVSPSAAFVAWPGNYRINPTGPLVGAGATFGAIMMCGWQADWSMSTNPWSGCYMPYDAADMFGTQRPQNGRYDVGAVMLTSGPPPSASFGGRMLLR